MSHVIEPAASGRARCRGCGAKIDKGELRFGERQPNAFGEGDMTLWFHLPCAAYKRPESFLERVGTGETDDVAAAELNAARGLVPAAEFGVEHRRLPRLDKLDRAPTGRALCRHCREPIPKGSWRIELVFFEEYRFEPSGYLHPGCAREYFGTTELMDRVRHFNPDLEPAELDEIKTALAADPG